jgi:hypothetical protein
VLNRRWPIPTTRQALEIGAAWGVLTVAFEFGFGHYVAGESWAELLAAYDVTDGEVWILIPLWMAAGPATVSALDGRRRVLRQAHTTLDEEGAPRAGP